MAHLDLGTHRIHYRVDGDDSGSEARPWLIFCNSLGTDLSIWDEQVADLGRDYRILRYDRRGHGQSTAPPPPYALADLGQDVIALMDELAIPRAHFCGISIGGLTGQWLGIHASSRFSKLIVCATASKIGTADGWKARMETVREEGLATLRAATSERWFSSAFASGNQSCVSDILKRFEATATDGYIGCCAALADADLTADLSRVSVPLLAIAGAEDPVCPPSDLIAIASGVRDGLYLSLPGRHIVNIESASSFNTVVSNFLLRS